MAETVRHFTTEDILAALRASTDHAFIEEQEAGQFIIDGKFNLPSAARKLSEKLQRAQS